MSIKTLCLMLLMLWCDCSEMEFPFSKAIAQLARHRIRGGQKLPQLWRACLFFSSLSRANIKCWRSCWIILIKRENNGSQTNTMVGFFLVGVENCPNWSFVDIFISQSLSTRSSQEDHIWKDLYFSPMEGCCWDQSLRMLRIIFMRIIFTMFTVERTCLFRRWRGCRVGARSLGGKYNLDEEEDDRL